MQPTTYKNMTASGAIKTGFGKLRGMYVNSTTAGTVKLWDSLSAAGATINNTITPAIGWHELGDCSFTIGLFATIGGTLDVTFYYA